MMSNLERIHPVYDHITDLVNDLIQDFLKENIPEIHNRLRQHGKCRNIRNLLTYFGEAADWSLFNDCFTNGIRFTDIDGLVERNGYFLLGEVKQEGVEIQPGQKLCFERLQETHAFTVVTIWGTTADPKKLHVYFLDGTNKPIDPVDFESFHTFIADWYAYVEKLDSFKNTIYTQEQVQGFKEEIRYLREKEFEWMQLKEEDEQIMKENDYFKQKQIKEDIINETIGRQPNNGKRFRRTTEKQMPLFFDNSREN